MTVKEMVIEEVNKIPYGKVASYGYIANKIGSTGWGVGIILSGLTPQECEDVAWQRIVNKEGYISSLKLGFKGHMQIELLEKEGVKIENFYVNKEFFIN